MNRRSIDRPIVIGTIAIFVVVVFICRLAFLQLGDNDYRLSAYNNALYQNVLYPSRGLIYDRNGKLLVYNQPVYDLMVIMREIKDLDTLDLCKTLGITKREFDIRMENIKDTDKNPGYSTYTKQLFLPQVHREVYSVFQEKQYRYHGFYIRNRTIRQYKYGIAAHVLGDVAEVSVTDLENDDYYNVGDYIGKQGVERSHEKDLRGKKGIQLMLRDARGRLKGHYKNGRFDEKPIPGKDIVLSIDYDLQALGEELMQGRTGSIVAIEPSTGEILCCVSAPGYDPRLLTGKNRGNMIMKMLHDENRPMFNRSISGTYPPGSTFKPAEGLMLLQERIVNTSTSYPCVGGFKYHKMKVGCHAHDTPLGIISALATSCNSYFCWGMYNFLKHSKYADKHEALNKWRDYMVSFGFGYKLGVDLPAEARGMIPNAEYYDKYMPKWNPVSLVSISIGQGEITLTPLQIANLGASIANRGYYITPHIVKNIFGGHLADSLTLRHNTMVYPAYYDVIRNGMRRAVLSGTCVGTNIPGLNVCGKTGTAQNRGHDHSAFLGFAPMENPKIVIAVYVENGGHGATTAVPIAARMLKKYLDVTKIRNK